jgi:tetratricopeptide (TPR) repeat protein
VWTLEPSDGDSGPVPPTTKSRDAIDRLTDLGLLEESGGETFRIHRLVVAFTLAEIPEEGAQSAVEAACSLAARRASRQGQPARQETLLPHVLFVTNSARVREDAMAANCCTALSISLGELRAHDDALPYAERAWEISVELYELEHRATLQRRSNIAFLLEGKKKREEARAISEEVLEAQERSLGREDPDVAATLNNLGASFVRDDLYHETLSLYRRALRIREAVWERTRPDDPDRSENAYELAESYGNMGALLMDLGRHEEARLHLASALEILADEVELAHERNADKFVNVGRALQAQGDYPGAVSSIESALVIYVNIGRTYSPAATLANVGAAYKEWAEKDQTLSASRRGWILAQASGSLHGALNGSEQMYGEDHPVTGGILRVLAGVYDAQGHSEDGRRFRARAEANRQGNIQGEDADAASTLNAHGTSLTGHGLYDEVHAYLERALRIRENTLGEGHFDTSTGLLKLGALHQLQGRDAEARLYLERARDIRANVRGETHPATELIRGNLSLLDP